MIDLHSHSTVSDGSDRPGALVEEAAAAGVSALALTDHDILDGLAEAATAADRVGIRLVRGCEVSCQVDRGTMHVVILFLDRPTGPLHDRLAEVRRARENRNDEIVARLVEAGFEITVDEVLARSGDGTVGRPHIAAVLLDRGYVGSIEEAFDRWLARGRPAYVERLRMTPEETIDLAHRSGAVAVLAHPFSLDRHPEELAPFVGELAEMGLDAMEVEYAGYQPEERAWLGEVADRHGLAPSGGSDYHGSYKPGLALGRGRGDLSVPDDWLDALEDRRPR